MANFRVENTVRSPIFKHYTLMPTPLGVKGLLKYSLPFQFRLVLLDFLVKFYNPGYAGWPSRRVLP